MDHRWDASTWADRRGRAEHERYGARGVERDPDVERRDRIRAEERSPAFNQSPWAIGAAHHDQRDLYTRNASMGADGYGLGPAFHPSEGSYAYPRDSAPMAAALPESDATVHEREAWPWLNYKHASEAPNLERVRGAAQPESLFRRVKARIRRALVPRRRGPHDDRIRRDVELALAFRRDLDASDVRVRVRGEEVTLEGTVADRRSKRVAEETAEGVSLVCRVKNRLSIRPDDPVDGELTLLRPLGLLWA